MNLMPSELENVVELLTTTRGNPGTLVVPMVYHGNVEGSRTVLLHFQRFILRGKPLITMWQLTRTQTL